jgi:hypothetical protein
MNRRPFGTLGVIAALATAAVAGCKSDPLSDLDGNPAALLADFSYLEVIIGDTMAVTAKVVDGRATPIVAAITFRTCNAVVTTAVDTTYHPVPATSTRALVIGETYGTSCVIAEGAGFADTVQIATFPASIVITGPDSIGSGVTTVFGFQYLDAGGAPVTGVPDPTFSSGDTTRAKVLPSPLGSVSARAPGVVTLTVSGTGSPAGGVTGTKSLTVVPGVFLGGIAPTSGDPTDTIKLTNAAGGPGFDADTRVFINNVRAFTFGTTVDSVKVIVPGMGAAGSVTLSLQNMGAAQVAQNASFTSTTASFADHYDAVNDDPNTSPEITANGDYFVVLSGSCVNGVGGADCDDFFKITNTGGASATVTVNVSWFTAADVDAYGLDPTFDFCTYDGGCPAATGANPEQFSMTVPVGETWFIYLNLWVTGGSSSSLTRVRVTGLP